MRDFDVPVYSTEYSGSDHHRWDSADPKDSQRCGDTRTGGRRYPSSNHARGGPGSARNAALGTSTRAPSEPTSRTPIDRVTSRASIDYAPMKQPSRLKDTH